jgi:AraC family transcriptional regulator
VCSAGPASRRADQWFADAKAWPEIRSEYSWLPPDPGVTTTGPNQIGVSFSEHHRAVIESGGRTDEVDIPGGTVVVTGPGPLVWARVRETTDAVEIYLDPLTFPELFRQDDPPIRPAVAARDAVVLGIASVLKRAHLGEIGLDDVTASTLAHRLAWQLGARYSTSPAVRRSQPPGLLSHRSLDRIAELVDAELSGPLTLSRLAAEAALSPYHFARAFRASTGLAPHQFVMMRRLERARNLITGTQISVAEIAHAVGFCNLSHFRRVFRRHTGWTPADLRQRPATSRRSP